MITVSGLAEREVEDVDLVIGAEDDELVVEQVEKQHLRVHLEDLGESVV